MIVKPYPKDDESRVLTISQQFLDILAARIQALGLNRDDLLLPSTETRGGNPQSAGTHRLGRSQLQTTQRYLHSLPGADEQALAAFPEEPGARGQLTAIHVKASACNAKL